MSNPKLGDFEKITNSSPENVADFYKRWNSENSKLTTFSQVDFFMRQEIIKTFSKHFENPKIAKILIETIRILSRDKAGIESLNTPEICGYILNYAALPPKNGFQDSVETIIEAQKCLINTLFNSNNMRSRFSENPESDNYLLQYLVDFNEKYRQKSSQQWIRDLNDENAQEMWYLYHRLGFIVTALVKNSQKSWPKDERIVKALFETAEIVIPYKIDRKITKRDNDRANEALKTVFNVFCHAEENSLKEEHQVNQILKELIISDLVDDDVRQSAINCFATPTIVPLATILCRKSPESQDQDDTQFVEAILRFLDEKLNEIPQDPQTTQTIEADLLGPFFSALSRLCRDNKYARRYCRQRVLPPLKDKDVEKRPEEGNTLRSKIVRLMMLPTVAKDLAAQFLFILCKKSVPRMIKYTGFGHSAGLLANMGLLGHINETKRESDSEDSETEEYNAIRDQVNPVTGAMYPPDRGSVLDNMSEEQKEYEAMKLMDAMNRMLDAGIVKPGTIGKDGKLREVSHVLELTKNIPDQEENESDSD